MLAWSKDIEIKTFLLKGGTKCLNFDDQSVTIDLAFCSHLLQRNDNKAEAHLI